MHRSMRLLHLIRINFNGGSKESQKKSLRAKRIAGPNISRLTRTNSFLTLIRDISQFLSIQLGIKLFYALPLFRL